jgi:NADPH2:quinone reductase
MSENLRGLRLTSTVKAEGVLELALVEAEVRSPGPDEVVVRIEAAPINPSDLGLLLGLADMSTAEFSGSPERPVVRASIPANFMKHMAGRLDEPMPVGNEGAGVVVAAGSSDAAQALMGRTVAVLGGAMYAQFRVLNVSMCLPLGEDTSPREGASCFVNPLTALGMVETMRTEDLVNIVRKPQQEEILRGIGASQVVNSAAENFTEDLTEALVTTGATLAFDAIGGGRLASDILACMEAAVNRNATEYSRYGSTTHKQVYIYGGLDLGPTELHRSFGMYWGVGGWLLTPFLQRIGPEATQRLKERVADEVKTTFASSYAQEVSLAGALQPDAIAAYGQKATGQKYLINPNAGL